MAAERHRPSFQSVYQRYAYWTTHTRKSRTAGVLTLMMLVPVLIGSIALAVVAGSSGNAVVLGADPVAVIAVALLAMVGVAAAVAIGEWRRGRDVEDD
jgi:threonine dehydrogenase-like Zn-dependent dehydrogenase